MHCLVMKEIGHATEATKLSQNNHLVFAVAGHGNRRIQGSLEDI